MAGPGEHPSDGPAMTPRPSRTKTSWRRIMCCCSESDFQGSHDHSSKTVHPSSKMDIDDRQPGQTDKPALPNGVHTNGVAPDPESLSQLDQIRDQVQGAVSHMKTLFNAIRAPLPTETGDGSQLPQKKSHSPGNDLKTVLRDINHLGFDRIEDLAETVRKSKLGQPLDDKK